MGLHTCAFSQVCAPGVAPWYLPLCIAASKFAHVHDPHGLVWTYALAYTPLQTLWYVHKPASMCTYVHVSYYCNSLTYDAELGITRTSKRSWKASTTSVPLAEGNAGLGKPLGLQAGGGLEDGRCDKSSVKGFHTYPGST